ncbi:MAG: hypothetical protein HYX78_01930 [Armatimonadetes bacterium]|nr:hypothetical protein [Armatimonadota bacterium]
MNCLLYAQIPLRKEARQSPSETIADHLAPLRDYAKKRSWNILDEVSDAAEPVKCANDAKLRNLRRALASNPSIDMVVVSTTGILSFSEYAALKTILDTEGIQLTILLSPRHSNPRHDPA